MVRFDSVRFEKNTNRSHLWYSYRNYTWLSRWALSYSLRCNSYEFSFLLNFVSFPNSSIAWVNTNGLLLNTKISSTGMCKWRIASLVYLIEDVDVFFSSTDVEYSIQCWICSNRNSNAKSMTCFASLNLKTNKNQSNVW